MHPILFHIGSYTIHSYFVLMYAGFLASVGWMKRCAPLFRVQGEATSSPRISGHQVSEAAWTSLVFFVLGGRLCFLALNPQEFLADPLEMVRLWHGGFSLLGGIVGVTLYVRWYCRKKGLLAAGFADIAAPGLALGGAIARLGCLLGGCCYGTACDLPWATRFPAPGATGVWTPPCHPTQLYESFADLSLLGLLFAYRPYARRTGEVGALWLLLYALARLLIEEFRKGVTSPILAMGLTGTQFVCLLALPLALAALIRLRTQGRQRLPDSLSVQPPG